MSKQLPIFLYPLLHRQRGLSLVELMISLTIGLILLAGITTLIVRQSSTRAELEKSSRQIENGRYAMQMLSNDIEHAGFYGEYSPPLSTAYTAPSNPCDTNPANQGWSPTSPLTAPAVVQGYAGASSNPAPSGCSSLITNYRPDTDILVIRRVASVPIEAANAVSGTTYLQTSHCNTDGSPFRLGTSNFTLRKKDCITPASLYGYIVRIYYISSCSVETGGVCQDSIPTLKMVEFMDGAQTTKPLVEGIENMQFDYGIDYLPLADKDGASDCYFPDPSNITAAQKTDCEAITGAAGNFTNSDTNLSNIVTVRVSLLARNTETTAGYTDNKSYQLGTTSVSVPTADQSYKRHAYSQLVRVVNASGRRE